MGYATVTNVLAVVLGILIAESTIVPLAKAQAPPPSTTRGAAVTTAINNFTSQNTTGPSVALTDGATIPVNAQGVGAYTLTVSTAQNGHSLACPTNLITGTRQWLFFKVTEGTGAPGFTGATSCYQWANGTVGFTGTVGAVDTVACSFEGGVGLCSVVPNFLPAKTVVAGGVGAVSSTTTASVTVTSIPIGSTVLCAVIGNAATAPTSVVGGSVTFPAAITSLSSFAGTGSIRIYAASNITSAITSVTATWASAPSFAQIGCDSIPSGGVVDGSGAGQLQTNPGTSASALSSGNMTPSFSGDVVWGVSTIASGALSITAGTGFTRLSQDAAATAWGMTTEWRVSPGTASIPATFTDATNGGTVSYATLGVLVH